MKVSAPNLNCFLRGLLFDFSDDGLVDFIELEVVLDASHAY
jgi:hypothetical protein